MGIGTMTVLAQRVFLINEEILVSVIDSLIITLQDFDPARCTRGGSIMQISQTRVVDPVIMYRAVGEARHR